MKVYISDLEQNYEIRIYGIDRKKHTEEFFTVVFGTDGIKKLDSIEQQAYGTKAEYAMSSKTLNAVAGIIDNTQIRKIHAQTASPLLTAMFDMVSYPKLNKKARTN